MKKNKNQRENYLDNIPVRDPELGWEKDEKGIVTLSRENKGIVNKIAQKLFGKPKVSYVHLDEIGSCVWQYIDGERTIYELAAFVKRELGDKAEPLYERIAKYFSILCSYGFVTFRK